ncbi:hypothetical protein H4R35_000836, partial [Dimargaris xerosporica]
MTFEFNGRTLFGLFCNVYRTPGWCVSYNYLSFSMQPNESVQNTLERTQLVLCDLPTNGFSQFLAKHLKAFSDPNEGAQFNINTDIAFSYAA